MKKWVSGVGAIALIMVWPARILAATNANHIVISEVQTGLATDASKEFVELYNPTASTMSVDNFTVEYASSSGTIWTKKATLTGNIVAHGFYLLSTAGYLSPDATMSSGFASTGGHIRIKDSAGTIIDLVGWGTAAHPETKIVNAPVAGGSIERLPGRLSDLAGNSQDTDDNSVDFVLREVAEPQNIMAVIEDPSSVLPSPDPVDETPPDDVVITPLTYFPVHIAEAFPDPASPLSDAKDEFIELYNPNSEAVNLKGYVLRTGSSFKSFYTIGDVSIAPEAYVAFFSVDTSLALPNSGSAVQLLDPLGNILDVSDAYGVAKTGQAWADINGVWSWTLQPTAGAANILSVPDTPVKATTSASSKSTTAAKPSNRKMATAKKTAAKSTRVASKKTKSTAKKAGIAAATSAITEPSPLARWLLIVAGCFTIMYAIYGFRHDLYNYYIKARRHTAAWLQDRPTLPWRRND